MQNEGYSQPGSLVILCDGCQEPIHAQCCAVCIEEGKEPVLFGMMKSFRTGRVRVVGNDGDDHEVHDGGVAHFCPKFVSLNETADGHNDTLNNSSGSPKPPQGLDNEVAENSDTGQGGENHYLPSGQPRIPANTYQTNMKWVVGTPCAYVDGCALEGANGEWFRREASFYDAEQRDRGNLACERLSNLFKKDVHSMNTTIDKLAAQEVSSDSEQQRK